jgi:YgiT-type zinc finger domain-containing protein
MRCTIAGCPGEYEGREVTRAVGREGRIMVIDHIPAEVCTVCGDVLFSPDTIERLEQLRWLDGPPERTVPLYEFAAARSA